MNVYVCKVYVLKNLSVYVCKVYVLKNLSVYVCVWPLNMHVCIYQPLRTDRMWHKVNF